MSAFIRAGHVVFEGDPAWVPPLDFEIKERLSPKKNPFFNRAEAMLFTAWKGDRLVGRCSASIDREHLRVWKDDTGFFGFFDTIDDLEVARALLDAAEAWLRARGMKRMWGPFSLYANEEVGLLIEGHEAPPMLSMAHSRTYQAALCDALGLAKEKDLLAYRWDSSLPFSKRALKAWEDVKAMPEVRLRSVDPSRMAEELQVVMDIYNDAWKDNWGHVPMTEHEVNHTVRGLKQFADDDSIPVDALHIELPRMADFAQVVAKLAIDVGEAARKGTHVGSGRKRQPDRVPRRGVRVLPHNEHTHLGERLPKRGHDPLRCRQNLMSRRLFLTNKHVKGI